MFIHLIANYGIDDLSFIPGSLGFDNPFIEIFLRGGNAFMAFRKPPIESDLEILL